MRLLLRLHDDRGWATVPPPQDLEVHCADDLRVGELAAALLDRLPGRHPADDRPAQALTVRSVRGALPPDALVADVGPASGSDVTVVPVGAHPLADGPPPSGTELVDAHGRRTPLPFGPTEVDDAEVVVDGRTVVRRRRPGPVAVNGVAVLDDVPLAHGDLLRTSGGLHTVVVEPSRTARPPHGSHRAHHGTAPWTGAGELPPWEPVVLPDPPTAVRRARLPWLSASVPLLMGLGLWLVTRSVASVVFVLFSGVFVLASSFESRRDARAERQFRDQEFTAALDGARSDLAGRAEGVQALAAQRHPAPRDQLPDRAGPHLWGRTDLSVRLGTGPVPVEGLVAAPGRHRTAPRGAEVAALLEECATLVLPVTVDLAGTGGLALVGDPARCEAVARTVATQLACAQGPDRLRLVLDPPPPWAAWLPHAAAGAAATTVHVLGPGAVDHGHRPMVRWGDDDVPDRVGAVLDLSGDAVAVLRRPGRPDQPVSLETVSVRRTEAAARSLAPLEPVGADGDRTTPDLVHLRDVLAPAPGSTDTLLDPS
ncbi:MAG: hypothetical protein ACKO04_06565, partial [Actinomycetes bacterium]